MTERNGTKRETGLKAVGRVRWGAHFCIFYETKQDLLEILVPYFEAGLTNNELCLWIVAPFEFLSVTEAKAALTASLPDLQRYLERKRLAIVPHGQWFEAEERIAPAMAIKRFRGKLEEAKKRGLEGCRVNGNSTWVDEQSSRRDFRRFENELDRLLNGERMMVACTFSLHLSSAEQILDAARTHDFGLTVRNGVWKRVEIADLAGARREAEQTHRADLGKLTGRQREILERIAEGQNTKQIAADLGISGKTVEAHRLQTMRRLGIHDVPGLVRFAIRAGLVSA
ncbi:MAG TPA: MEDS domain-containing protein [Chthoniobacterales bacterium]